jgi:hypothetical protein
MHAEKCCVVPLGDSQTESAVRGWERFYESVFMIKKDFSGLSIPERREGFDRLIIVAQEMDFHAIAARATETCPISLYPDGLSYVVSPRVPDRDYAVWARDGVECDSDLRGISKGKLLASGVIFETAEERLLHGMKFFKEHYRKGAIEDRQLDRKFCTLTSSCDRYGRPLVIHFHSKEGVKIDWFDAYRCRASLGARRILIA